MDGNEIIDSLRDLIPELGGPMGQAGNYIVTQTDDLAMYSMRELAQRAGVPPVTFVRLSQRLGLSGYRELRQRCVESLLQRSQLQLVDRSTRRNIDSARTILESAKGHTDLLGFANAFFEAEHEVLRRAQAAITEERLSTTIEILAKAPNVFVASRRTSYPPAFTFAYALSKARPNVRLLEDAAGGPEGPLEDVGPGDAFVAFTFAPFSRVTDILARRAAAAKAHLIAVSDSAAAPLRVLVGDLFFVAPSLSRAFPESAAGAVAIANLLAALTVAKLGDKAQTRIRRNEEFLVGSGEYMISNLRSRRKTPTASKK